MVHQLITMCSLCIFVIMFFGSTILLSGIAPVYLAYNTLVSAQIISSGQRYWIEADSNQLNKQTVPTPIFGPAITITSKLICSVTVSPNPVTTDKITITVDAALSVSVLVRLYTLQGDIASNLWLGTLKSGTNTIEATLPALSSGTYSLLIEGNDGKPLGHSSVVIKN